MVNLQLEDSTDGGYFLVNRNDYVLDKGIYTELYSCLFGTSTSQWWADNAFGINSQNITSKTGIALKVNASINTTSLSLIEKAVRDDLKRFTNKNANIEVSDVMIAYYSKTILIVIELTGYNEAFNFIYQSTSESLENAKFKTF